MVKCFSSYNFLTCTVFAVVILSTGCTSNDGVSITPTNTSLVFSTFPDTYFDGSYSTSYSLSGGFSNGEIASAFLGIQSGSTTTFNAQPVETIDRILYITNTSNGSVSSSIKELYYSTDMNNLLIEGGYEAINGVSTMATSASVIPQTASIGDFGFIGDYTLSNGTNTIVTWAMLDGFNGNAKFTKTSVNRDSSNELITTSIESWIISQDGTRTGLTIATTFHQIGDLVLIISTPKG